MAERLLIADFNGLDLWEIDPDGLDTEGTRLRLFPTGLTTPVSMTNLGGRLLIADFNGLDLWEIDPDGLDTEGTRLRLFPTGLTDPRGMTNLGGRLLMADRNGGDLWEIDPDGADTEGTRLRYFPTGLTDSRSMTNLGGRLLIGDTDGDDLWEIDPDGADTEGTRLRYFPGFGSPYGMANLGGRLLVVEQFNRRLYQIDPDGADNEGQTHLRSFPTGLTQPQAMTSFFVPAVGVNANLSASVAGLLTAPLALAEVGGTLAAGASLSGSIDGALTAPLVVSRHINASLAAGVSGELTAPVALTRLPETPDTLWTTVLPATWYAEEFGGLFKKWTAPPGSRPQIPDDLTPPGITLYVESLFFTANSGSLSLTESPTAVEALGSMPVGNDLSDKFEEQGRLILELGSLVLIVDHTYFGSTAPADDEEPYAWGGNFISHPGAAGFFNAASAQPLTLTIRDYPPAVPLTTAMAGEVSGRLAAVLGLTEAGETLPIAAGMAGEVSGGLAAVLGLTKILSIAAGMAGEVSGGLAAPVGLTEAGESLPIAAGMAGEVSGALAVDAIPRTLPAVTLNSYVSPDGWRTEVLALVTAGGSGSDIFRSGAAANDRGVLEAGSDVYLNPLDKTVNRIRVLSSGVVLLLNASGGADFSVGFESAYTAGSPGSGSYLQGEVVVQTLGGTAVLSVANPDELDDAGGGYLRMRTGSASDIAVLNGIVAGTRLLLALRRPYQMLPVRAALATALAGALAAPVSLTEVSEVVPVTASLGGALSGLLGAPVGLRELATTIGVSAAMQGAVTGALTGTLALIEQPETRAVNGAMAAGLSGALDDVELVLATSWPGSLPQLFLERGFEQQPFDNVVRFRVDQGPDRRRRRYSRVPGLLQGGFILTPDQWTSFKRFYLISTRAGVDQFDIPAPMSTAGGAIAVKWRGAPTRFRDGANWAVQLRLLELG